MTFFLKVRDYFIESMQELKKVIWPSKEQTLTYTLLVIGMSVGLAVFFGILDYALNLGLEQIIK